MLSRVAVALVALALLAAGVLFFAGRLLVVTEPLPAKADAIVMLAGSTADRALETAELYRAHIAPRVVITRTRLARGEAVLRARGIHIPEEDERARSALEQLGVPPAAIVRLRRRTRSTENEARTVARWAASHGIRSLVVVTSRAPTRRTRLIFERALEPGVALTVRGSRYDSFAAGRWWRVRRDAKMVLYEYERLAHHFARERWKIEPCGGLRPCPRPRPG
jgi:uncharacterized SAM-binding protein YcdF (DUF218 family)